MNSTVENLVLEHLRQLRGLGENTLQKVNDLTVRMGRVEERIAGLHTEVSGLHADYAHLSVRIGRVENRLDRIERRLNLADA